MSSPRVDSAGWVGLHPQTTLSAIVISSTGCIVASGVGVDTCHALEEGWGQASNNTDQWSV